MTPRSGCNVVEQACLCIRCLVNSAVSRNFCHFMSSFAVMLESVEACVKLVCIVIFGFYFNA